MILNGKTLLAILLFCVANLMKNVIVSDEFNVKETCTAPAQDITEMEAESPTALPNEIVNEAEMTRPGETVETALTDLEAVGHLHDEVLTEKVTVEEACMSQGLMRIIEKLDVTKNNLSTLYAQLSCGFSS